MALPSTACLLLGADRIAAIDTLRLYHYTHSVPSGKTHYYRCGDALVSFSIPPNNNIARFVLGRDATGGKCGVWELSRMWAPDNHARDLLTRAISLAVIEFHTLEPVVEALISYADPNVGHSGHVYAAASWTYAGRSEESRYYIGTDGLPVARRKFHSGHSFIRKADILALGYREVLRPGKLRYVRGLTRRARVDIRARWNEQRPRPTVRELVLSHRRKYQSGMEGLGE